MANSVDTIEGIGPKLAEKLAEAGIKNTDQLLEAAGTAAGRKGLAESTGISGKLILKFANHADLMRIKGIGGEYAELLEAAGVDTVKELRHRNAENLSAKMGEVNEEKSLTRRVPSAKVLQGWIDEAKETEPAISH
jgi:predicted flap endonuclease-1-like 5' DNA nuclease